MHPFFAGMPPSLQERLARAATFREFPAGRILLREGQPAHEFFVILEGAVAIEAAAGGRSPASVETVSDGEVVGWSWLFPPYVSHFQARVLEFTRVLSFDGASLAAACEHDRELGYEIIRRLALVLIQRLQSVRRETVLRQ